MLGLFGRKNADMTRQEGTEGDSQLVSGEATCSQTLGGVEVGVRQRGESLKGASTGEMR